MVDFKDMINGDIDVRGQFAFLATGQPLPKADPIPTSKGCVFDEDHERVFTHRVTQKIVAHHVRMARQPQTSQPVKQRSGMHRSRS